MEFDHVWTLNLQLFGEGSGDGGASGASAGADGTGDGATSADGDLSNVVYGKQPEAAQPEAAAQDEPRDLSADFEALIKGEYKQAFADRTQAIIDKRFKQAKALEAQQKEQAPVLNALASRYGIDLTGKTAMQDLLAAMDKDDGYLETEAAEKGLSVAQLKEIKRTEAENAQLRQAVEERQRQEARDNVYNGWLQAAEQVAQIYPGFDLNAEVSGENGESFVRLLQSGIDVKTAYEVIHKDELLSGAIGYAVKATQQRTVDNIRARGMRPTESGAGVSKGATQIVKSDPSTWSDRDMDEVLRRVRSGEKIPL